MLILTRKSEEEVLIGPDIRVRIIDIQGKQVRLGLEAPHRYPIHRSEVIERIHAEQAEQEEHHAGIES